MSQITLQELKALCDFEARERLVRATLRDALATPLSRVRFIAWYTSWNGFFGSGVAALAGKIGRSRGLFLDPAQSIRAVADRSVYVASFFFDAARDEFDDRDTVHRDTHRCLAQSTLMGVIDHAAAHGAPELATPAAVNALIAEPAWLRRLHDRVALGYGVGTADDLPSIFTAIGYHLGSELLADQEFSIIDATLRGEAAPLVDYLKTATISIAGQEHVAYQWVSIHSGHGGGAEADHFEWATQGARLASRFTPHAEQGVLKERLQQGFQAFAADHLEFFQQVNAARSA